MVRRELCRVRAWISASMARNSVDLTVFGCWVFDCDSCFSLVFIRGLWQCMRLVHSASFCQMFPIHHARLHLKRRVTQGEWRRAGARVVQLSTNPVARPRPHAPRRANRTNPANLFNLSSHHQRNASVRAWQAFSCKLELRVNTTLRELIRQLSSCRLRPLTSPLNPSSTSALNPAARSKSSSESPQQQPPTRPPTRDIATSPAPAHTPPPPPLARTSVACSPVVWDDQAIQMEASETVRGCARPQRANIEIRKKKGGTGSHAFNL